jgi:hypothetical protein
LSLHGPVRTKHRFTARVAQDIVALRDVQIQAEAGSREATAAGLAAASRRIFFV